jgi:hypothetical protein
MGGGKIEASDNIDFRNAIVIDSILKPTQFKDIHLPDDSLCYRYWRYISPNGGHCNIAELAFYKEGESKPTYAKIIGTEGSYFEGDKFKKEAAFDGDILTRFDAPMPDGAWVGMDFGEKVNITRIVCVARGDGNSIEFGNEYELLYWGENKWVSMGRKTADDFYVKYENCPTNALFLLRNHTKGKDERIFTYENNKQIWW